MPTPKTIKFAFIMLILIGAFMAATPARATVTQRCNWGVGLPAPIGLAPNANQWPLSTQVMMMPTVMDFGSPPFSISQAAFVTFKNASEINRDGGGVLRIIDAKCREIARFPDLLLSPLPIPPFCPASLNTVPDLAPASGLAVGNLDNTSDVEIVGVIGGPTQSHKQIIAFNLVGPLNNARLVPKWCSPPLAGADVIPGSSAPAIAQLDRPPDPAAQQSEVIIDNKVFEFNGALRYTGLSGPRSRAVVVANPLGISPQMITGRRAYQSVPPFWTGTLAWQNLAISNGPLVYPAVADLDLSSNGPEIVVVDTMQRKLFVLSASGVTLDSIAIPSPGFTNCGGPPMIGNADGIPGAEIGVAGCNLYTLFRYSGGVLSVLWSKPTNDQGGQTTSTLVNTPTGAFIFYADMFKLWKFAGANGNVIQSLPNSSGTAIEGPVIAAFDTGGALGSVIVGANNYWVGTNKGVRIFDDPALGPAVSYWGGHTNHRTNVTNSHGAIPIVEQPSWLNSSPARNTYRAQQWP